MILPSAYKQPNKCSINVCYRKERDEGRKTSLSRRPGSCHLRIDCHYSVVQWFQRLATTWSVSAKGFGLTRRPGRGLGTCPPPPGHCLWPWNLPSSVLKCFTVPSAQPTRICGQRSTGWRGERGGRAPDSQLRLLSGRSPVSRHPHPNTGRSPPRAGAVLTP